MQEAFQKGAESEFENLDFEILPEEDINKSLETKGAIAYKAVMNNEIVGGAIVIDELTQYNHLDFLYVKYGIQGKGIGKFIKCVRTLVALAVRGSDLHYCNGCCYVWIFSSFIDNDKEKKKRRTRMVRTKS